MARIFISAAHKSSGKTTVSIGLCAAFRARRLTVQPFKKGPDYIDPQWLGAAAGRICRNLDHHVMDEDRLAAYQRHHGAGADLCLIEGNKGLYDGVSPDGRDCSAALARLTRAPAVLVIDCGGITRGIAPLLLGYRLFDPGVTIGGVILNKVAGSRHEAKLRAAVETHTDIPVLGALHRDGALAIDERHLGLVPANESAERDRLIAACRRAVEAQVDLDRVLAVARAAPVQAMAPRPRARRVPGRLRVGIAMDGAFGFYYPDDLEALEAEGFRLVPFDTLRDRHLPADLDGLFLGGGFPETHLDALEANATLRAEIRAAALAGLPVYAECGGMMYLSRGITWRGRTAAMVGALPADAIMHDRPQGRGYVRLRGTGQAPWAGEAGEEIAAHEFHYAGLENLPADTRFAYRVLRGHGIGGGHDGIVQGNTLASFSHRRTIGADCWANRFAGFMRAHAGPAVSERQDQDHTFYPVFPIPEAGAQSPCPVVKPSMPATPSAPAP